MSQEERNRMKEEYKEQYRLLLEQKKRLAAYERKAKIMQSLKEIDPSPVLESFQGALQAVRERIVQTEARLEVYLDDRARGGHDSPSEARRDEEAEAFTRRQKASEMMNQIRAEMGTIERDLEEKAEKMDVAKTMKPAKKNPEHTSRGEASPGDAKPDNPARTNSETTKTIGRRKT